MKNSIKMIGSNIRFRYLFAILMFLVAFSSCKKQKELVTVSQKLDKEIVETKIMSSFSNFETFQSKISLNFNDGKKDITLGAQIRMFKDSKIQISVQPVLGIELFKLELSDDSIKIVDKINKRYVAEGYDQYRSLLPVDLRIGTLQALFLNNLFIPGDDSFGIDDFGKFKWNSSSAGDLEGKLKNNKLYNLLFKLDNKSLLTTTSMSSASESHTVDWNYSGFQPLDSIEFPRVMDILYNGKGKKMSAKIRYQKIEINKNISDRFDIPSSYQRVTASQVINMLMKK